MHWPFYGCWKQSSICCEQTNDKDVLSRAMRRLLYAFASACVFVGGISAADRYVSPTGNNANAGTLVAPWATIQYAASNANAGDTVYVRGGTYSERVNVTKNGTAAAPLIIREYPGEVPIIDQTGVTPANGGSALVTLTNRSHVIIQGLTLQNYRTADDNKTPIGILVSGSGSGVHLLGNTVRNIEQNNTVLGNFDANAHGILVEGTGTTQLTNIVIDGNHVYDLHLGASEALVLNGNVTNFRVVNNIVHDCNNIGIDLIGYEGTGPSPAQDRARNGLVAGNVVYNIDSSFNPAYDGNLTTGGGERSAAGIYVDGGSSIIIEQNIVYACNYGVELASEDPAGTTDQITLRNNLIRHNQQAGLIMGGYNSGRGTTTQCLIANNTLYKNDFINPAEPSGQIALQFYVTNCTFKNNILCPPAGRAEMVIHYPVGGASARELGTTNVFNHNLYYSTTGQPEFQAFHNGSRRTYSTLAAWQGSGVSGGDVGSSTGNPLFQLADPHDRSSATAYALSPTSPAINTGEPNSTYQPGSGEEDLFENSRIRGGRVDRGAAEF